MHNQVLDSSQAYHSIFVDRLVEMFHLLNCFKSSLKDLMHALCWWCFVCFQSNRVRLPALNFASLEKWLSLDSLSKHDAYSCVSLNALNGWHDRPICSFSQSSNWLHFLLAVIQLKLRCFLSQLLSHYFGNNSRFSLIFLIWEVIWDFLLGLFQFSWEGEGVCVLGFCCLVVWVFFRAMCVLGRNWAMLIFA